MKTNPNDPAIREKPLAIVDMQKKEIFFSDLGGKMRFDEYFTEFDMTDGKIEQETVRRILREDGFKTLFQKLGANIIALNESSTKD